MRRSIVTATSAAVVAAGLCTVANAMAVSPGRLVKSTETSVTQVHWRHRHWRGWHRPRVYGYYAPRVYARRGYRGCGW